MRRTNLIDSPGLLRAQSSARSGPDQRAGADSASKLLQHRHQDDAGWNSSSYRRRCHGRARRETGLHNRHRKRKACGTAQHQSPARQQHHRKSPTKSTRKSTLSARRFRRESDSAFLRPVDDRGRVHQERARRDSAGVVLASIILVVFLRDWGTSVVAGLVIPVTVLFTFVVLKTAESEFQSDDARGLAAAVGLVIDDAIVVVENIVLHRDAGQGRLAGNHSALHEITIPLVGSTITPVVVFSSPDVDHRRYWNFFSRPGGHHGGVALYFASPGFDLDAKSEPVFSLGGERTEETIRLGEAGGSRPLEDRDQEKRDRWSQCAGRKDSVLAAEDST